MAQDDQNTGLQLQIPGMDQFKDLNFIQSETNPADLVVQLPDGSEVIFPNYLPLAQAGAPPAITLEDGTVVPGQEIVSLIEDLDYDLIAPAAGGDTVGPVTGGGAGFASDPSGSLGDDIGHGPYAGGIQIADAVEFEQLLGTTDPDGGDGGVVPSIFRSNNVGDNFSLMMETSVGLSDRPVETGPFTVELETFASVQPPSNPFVHIDPVEDWDGMSIYLREGETVTINHHVRDGVSLDPYYVALGVDPDAPANDPLGSTGGDPLGWEYYNSEGSISYVADVDGWVYVGTGFDSTTTPGSYYTEVMVDDDNILVGTGGDDIFDGGARDEMYIGGGGSDQFMFESAADGHDTIADFSAAEGDIVNLDALFDALSVPSAAREGAVSLSESGGDTTLEVSGQPGFSITFDNTTGMGSVADLISSGNLVVDES